MGKDKLKRDRSITFPGTNRPDSGAVTFHYIAKPQRPRCPVKNHSSTRAPCLRHTMYAIPYDPFNALLSYTLIDTRVVDLVEVRTDAVMAVYHPLRL